MDLRPDPIERLKFCSEIIENFIVEYGIPGTEGIHLEHQKVAEIISGKTPLYSSLKAAKRYGETSYLLWALNTELNRKDLLLNNIRNWGSGEDEIGSSHFRNFEFECHTALRFLEEGNKVTPIVDGGNPEFCINDTFAIECKRPFKLEGLFLNTLKAKQQIDKAKIQGFLIFNLDDLENFNPPSSDVVIYSALKELSLFSEFGMGTTETNLKGVLFEYLGSQSAIQNSHLYAIKNNLSHISEPVTNTISKALTGHENLIFDNNTLKLKDRYPLDYNKKEKEKSKLAYDIFSNQTVGKYQRN